LVVSFHLTHPTLFVLSIKILYTSYRPISVADFGWRVTHVKRFISSCRQIVCF